MSDAAQRMTLTALNRALLARQGLLERLDRRWSTPSRPSARCRRSTGRRRRRRCGRASRASSPSASTPRSRTESSSPARCCARRCTSSRRASTRPTRRSRPRRRAITGAARTTSRAPRSRQLLTKLRTYASRTPRTRRGDRRLRRGVGRRPSQGALEPAELERQRRAQVAPVPALVGLRARAGRRRLGHQGAERPARGPAPARRAEGRQGARRGRAPPPARLRAGGRRGRGGLDRVAHAAGARGVRAPRARTSRASRTRTAARSTTCPTRRGPTPRRRPRRACWRPSTASCSPTPPSAASASCPTRIATRSTSGATCRSAPATSSTGSWRGRGRSRSSAARRPSPCARSSASRAPRAARSSTRPSASCAPCSRRPRAHAVVGRALSVVKHRPAKGVENAGAAHRIPRAPGRLRSPPWSGPVERKRMLVIVNPYATTVSDRLKNLVVYALQGRYEVDAMDTEGRDHATVLCREAAEEGYDVVVAFGGDGTVNEAANGLAHSPTPLTCLPGGATNVYCKMLGVPERHRRRHRAPAAPRRRLDAAPGRPRPRQRPRLHLLGGLRARRLGRAPRRRPSER